MTTCLLKLDLSSYWHIGSGRGDSAQADAIVLRGPDHLPLVPGRTIKGLLRDAMLTLVEADVVPMARLVRWFGSALPGQGPADEADGDAWGRKLEQGRFSTEAGALWIGSAELPPTWRAWARAQGPEDETVSALFAYLASTAIDERGLAKEGTLRVAEVAVPMPLTAEIRGPEDETWVRDLESCLPLVRAVGSRRNRGFGRVSMSLERVK